MSAPDRGASLPARKLLYLLFGVAVGVRAVFLLFPALDSDQAIIGLMGRHVLQGEFPAFFWGEPYSGTPESFLAAVFFAVFGASRQTLALSPLLVSLAFLWAAWRLALDLFGERAGLLTLALLAVPPIYLSWNSVLPRGNYVENLFLGTLCLLLAHRLAAVDLASPRGRRLSWLLGGLAGFAWYVNFQVVSYLVIVLGYLGWRHRLGIARAVPVVGVAFLIGSLPFWTENARTGFASLDAIRHHAGTLGIGDGLQRTAAQLPLLLGARGGFEYTYEQAAAPILPFAGLLVLAVIGAAAGGALVADAVRRHRGTLFLGAFAASVVAVVVVGGFSAGPADPRYLMPLYSALPILAAAGFAAAWRWRPVVLAALTLLVGSNAYTHWSVARAELQRYPQYRAEDRQLLEFLVTRGMTHVYAPDYWLSYWLTFDAREDVIVAPPFWQHHARAVTKFPNYTHAVRRQGRPAYLFWGRRAPFEAALRAAGIAYETTEVGRFVLLHDFRPPPRGRALASSAWRAADAPARLAFDRDPWTAWEGTEFRIDLGAVHPVSGLALLLAPSAPEPLGFAIEGSVDGAQWRPLARLDEVIPGLAYGDEGPLLLEEPRRVAVALRPTPLRHLRVLPSPADRPWALAELFVFEPADEPPSALLREGVRLEVAGHPGRALGRYAARLLAQPDDEQAMRRTMVTARELDLEGWSAIYDFLSAPAPDRPLEWRLRFARRFQEVAVEQEVSWRRLAETLVEAGDVAGANAVRQASLAHFTPAVPQDVVFGWFGPRVRLLGYAVDRATVRPGETVEVRYYWELCRPVPRNSWVFVQFHDGRRTRWVHQHLLPTGLRERVRESRAIRVPENLHAGRYTMRVGLWQAESGRRLRVWRGGWPTVAWVAEVGTIDVVPGNAVPKDSGAGP